MRGKLIVYIQSVEFHFAIQAFVNLQAPRMIKVNLTFLT